MCTGYRSVIGEREEEVERKGEVVIRRDKSSMGVLATVGAH